MHEHSLVRSLLGQVERLRIEQGGEQVREVRVENGPLSGVESMLVAAAFARLRHDIPAAAVAELFIDEAPLEVQCPRCGRDSEVRDFRFRCGCCGHDAVRVVRGDTFQLVSVTLDVPDPYPPMAEAMR